MKPLRAETYLNLMTFKRDGSGVATPVWFACLGDRAYVFTDGTSFKVKRLRRNPAARIAACSTWGAVHGPWFDTQARVVRDSTTVEKAYEALYRKYGWQMRLVDLVSRLAGRLDRRAILEIDLDGVPTG